MIYFLCANHGNDWRTFRTMFLYTSQMESSVWN